MPKTEECDRCQMFSGSCDPEHLVCGIHPSGPEQSPCLDFAEVTEQWEPLGAGYYDGELVLQPEHYLSTEERLEILNTHPLFTGVCPECGAEIEPQQRMHYDCEACGWLDDSVV
jgi:predicted RNA-binding Zn-ribbon protein involved in translation (DUF1610 family)